MMNCLFSAAPFSCWLIEAKRYRTSTSSSIAAWSCRRVSTYSWERQADMLLGGSLTIWRGSFKLEAIIFKISISIKMAW